MGPRGEPELPYSLETPIENMLASFGDAMSTNWLDPSYEVWRDATGAAVGYQRIKKHAVVWGNPVCLHTSAVVSRTLQGFQDYCAAEKLNPVFCCVSSRTEQVLCRLGWASVSCAAGNYASGFDQDRRSAEAKKKIRHAQRDETRVEHYDGLPPDDLRERIDAALERWQKSRTGKQVHTSTLSPWRDAEHRHYFVSGPPESDDSDEVYGLLVMTDVCGGTYIKWSLEMPDAPSGTSELQASTAIDWAQGNGWTVSWGSGASDAIEPGHHLGRWKLRILHLTYQQVHSLFRLGNKVDFRRKLGLEEVNEYVCWRKFGVQSLRAILASIQE